MHVIRKLLLVALIVCAVVSRVRADDSAISPFVNDQTLVVVRFDVKTLDPAATLQSCGKLLAERGDDPQRVAAMQNVWQQRADNAQTLVKGLQKAGATHLYWLLSATDFTHDLSLPTAIGATGKGAWIVPVDAAADRAAIAKLIIANPNNAMKPILQLQEIGSAVVAAKPGRQINHDGAALSPEWVKALTPNEPIVVASVPGELFRRSFEENLPTLQTPAGSVPIKQFTRGVRWISIAIASQSFSGSGTIECTDAATAMSIADFINAAVAPLKGKPIRVLDSPFSPIANASELFICHAEGTQVRCTPDANALTVPMVLQQMHDSLTVMAKGNMQQLLLGSIMYVNQHREFAPSLEVMMKEQEMSPRVLEDPFQPGVKDAWVYVKPAGAATDPKTPVLYEKSDTGLLVGFADGHVESLESRAAVTKLFSGAH